jgi:hypothetical protein
MITHILDIPVEKLTQDYVRIENLGQYLFEVEKINPVDLGRYIPYWRDIKQLVIEGTWGEESTGYRYMFGDLLFYGNFCVIQRTNAAKVTEPIKPLVRDLDWEMCYGVNVASGFSGFSDDEQFTSDRLVLDYEKTGIPTSVHEELKIRHMMLFNSKGELKHYIDPLTYLKKTHHRPLGKALWYNEACNYSTLGSRGGGKSYFFSLGKGLHAIVTDGAKYYNNLDGKYYKDPLYREEYSQPIAEIMVGSGNSDKSSEFAIKMQFAMNQFATNPDFGVWGKEGDEDHTPIPFFKQMVGSIGPNNKENPWRHEYSVINKGREIKKGSKSKLYHVSYFEGKAQGKGSQAGAGGRVLYSFTEESGLTGNTIEIHNSNKFVVSRDGVQFGVQVDLGTSGNIESVQQTKKKFMNPHDYDILPYKDPEGLGQYGDIGFFLPFYLTLNFCKDEDGNTIYEKAFAETLKRREKAAQSTDPSVLREEKMNAPILPSEMWISKKGYYLPYDEAVNRQKDLSKNGLFMDLGTPAKFVWDSKQPYGVKMEPELDLQPYYNFPIESNRMTKEAPPVIYEHPIYIHGEIPQGMYFSVYDPYVSDNLEDGGSLGTTFILLAPLYWDEYLTEKGPIVATYTAKHAEGLDGYHEVQEKLLAYYGNQDNAHYYEKNRGRSCRDYYIKKGKAYMLGLQPGTYDSSSTVAKRIAEYGISVPNGPKKIQMLDETSDWLKSEVITKTGDIKRVIELMSCKFTVDQIVDFSIDKASNYDAVSALILIPTVIKEREFFFTEKVTGKNKSNPLNFLTSNERLWSRRN